MLQPKRYGWVPDSLDHRDKLYKSISRPKLLPDRVDLRLLGGFFPSYDQGSLGSCVSNALAKAISYIFIKDNAKTPISPSRLFIYYNGRSLAGTVSEDSGLQIRNGIKALARWGVCDESLWPYEVNKFDVKPSFESYGQALHHQALNYSRLNSSNIREMQDCLASGYPFVFGFTVYESFESETVAKTAVLPMPMSSEYTLGGHAVICVGYNNATKQFIVQNSWGDAWGDHGFFYMPYGYMTRMANDVWAIKTMEDSD